MSNSSYMIPLYMMLSLNCIILPLALLEDDSSGSYEEIVVHAMTAPSADEADERGMRNDLKPYFTECQADAGITPGVKEGVTYDMANNVITCMENKYSAAQQRQKV